MTPTHGQVETLLDRSQLGGTDKIYIEDFLNLRIDYSKCELPHTELRRDYKWLLAHNAVIRERIDSAFIAYVNLLRGKMV